MKAEARPMSSSSSGFGRTGSASTPHPHLHQGDSSTTLASGSRRSQQQRVSSANRQASSAYYDIASTILGSAGDLDDLLLNAARDGDYNKVEQLLVKRGDIIVDIDCHEKRSGNTPLIWAAKRGHNKIVQLLLRHGADPTLRNNENRTAVEEATGPTVTILLDSVTKASESSHRLLLQAAWQGNIQVIRRLLSRKGLDINCQNAEGLTPLMLVARDIQMFELLSRDLNMPYSPVEVAQELMKARADVHTKDNDGRSCLHYASQSMASVADKMVHAFLGGGSEPGMLDRRQYMPIHWASQHGNTNVVLALLKGGSEINCRGFIGLTPLHISAHNDNQCTALALLDRGADVTLLDDRGLTAVDLAKKTKLKTILREAWTEATQAGTPELAPVRATPSREAQGQGSRSSTREESPAQRRGEVIFDGAPSNLLSVQRAGQAGRQGMTRSALAAAAAERQQRRADRQLLQDMESGRYTPSLLHGRESTRPLGTVRNKPGPPVLPNISRGLPAPAPGGASGRQSPESPPPGRRSSQGEELRRSLEDGRNLLSHRSNAKRVSQPMRGGRLNKTSPVSTAADRTDQGEDSRPSASYRRTHRRTGSDPFNPKMADVAATIENIINNRRGESGRSDLQSLAGSQHVSPLRLGLEREREASMGVSIPTTIPEACSPGSSTSTVTFHTGGSSTTHHSSATTHMMSLPPTSNRILPPTPTFLTQRSYTNLDSALSRMTARDEESNSSKEPSPRSDDEGPAYYSSDKFRVGLTNPLELLRSRSLLKEEFILAESRPSDPTMMSSGSDPSASSSSSLSTASSSPRDGRPPLRRPDPSLLTVTLRDKAMKGAGFKKGEAIVVKRTDRGERSGGDGGGEGVDVVRDRPPMNSSSVMSRVDPVQGKVTRSQSLRLSQRTAQQCCPQSGGCVGEGALKRSASSGCVPAESERKNMNSSMNTNTSTSAVMKDTASVSMKDSPRTSEGREQAQSSSSRVRDCASSYMKDSPRSRQIHSGKDQSQQSSVSAKDSSSSTQAQGVVTGAPFSGKGRLTVVHGTFADFDNVFDDNDGGAKCVQPTPSAKSAQRSTASTTTTTKRSAEAAKAESAYVTTQRLRNSSGSGSGDGDNTPRMSVSDVAIGGVGSQQPDCAPLVSSSASAGGNKQTMSACVARPSCVPNSQAGNDSSSARSAAQTGRGGRQTAAVSGTSASATSSSSSAKSGHQQKPVKAGDGGIGGGGGGNVKTSQSSQSSSTNPSSSESRVQALSASQGRNKDKAPVSSSRDSSSSRASSTTRISNSSVAKPTASKTGPSSSLSSSSSSLAEREGQTSVQRTRNSGQHQAVRKSASTESLSTSRAGSSSQGRLSSGESGRKSSLGSSSSHSRSLSSSARDVTSRLTSNSTKSPTTGRQAKAESALAKYSSSEGKASATPRTSTAVPGVSKGVSQSSSMKASSSSSSLSSVSKSVTSSVSKSVTSSTVSKPSSSSSTSSWSAGISAASPSAVARVMQTVVSPATSHSVTNKAVKDEKLDSKPSPSSSSVVVVRSSSSSGHAQDERPGTEQHKGRSSSSDKANKDDDNTTNAQPGIEPLVKITFSGMPPTSHRPTANISRYSDPATLVNPGPIIVNPFEDMTAQHASGARPSEAIEAGTNGGSGGGGGGRCGIAGKPDKKKPPMSAKSKAGTKGAGKKGGRDGKRPLSSSSRQTSAGKKRGGGGAKNKDAKDSADEARPKSGKRVRSGKRRGKKVALAAMEREAEKEAALLRDMASKGDMALISGIGWHMATTCADTSDVFAASELHINSDDSEDSEISDVESIEDAEALMTKLEVNRSNMSLTSPRFREIKARNDCHQPDPIVNIPALTGDGFPPMNLDVTQKGSALSHQLLTPRGGDMGDHQGMSMEDLHDDDVHREVMMGMLTPIPEMPSLPMDNMAEAIARFDRSLKGSQLNDMLEGPTPRDQADNHNSLRRNQDPLSQPAQDSVNKVREGKKTDSARNDSVRTASKPPPPQVEVTKASPQSSSKETTSSTKPPASSRDPAATKPPSSSSSSSKHGSRRTQSLREESSGSRREKPRRRERKFSESKKDDEEEEEEIDNAIEEILSATGTSSLSSTLRSNTSTLRSGSNTLTEGDRSLLVKLKAHCKESPFHASKLATASVADNNNNADDDDDDDDASTLGGHNSTGGSSEYLSNPNLLKVMHVGQYDLGAKVKAMIDAGADESKIKAMMEADENVNQMEARQIVKVMNSFRHMELHAGASNNTTTREGGGVQRSESHRVSKVAAVDRVPLVRPSSAGAARSRGRFHELKKGSAGGSSQHIHDRTATKAEDTKQSEAARGSAELCAAVVDEALAGGVPADVLADPASETMCSRLSRHSSRAGSACTDNSQEEETIQWKKGNVLGKGAFGTVWCGLTNEGQLIAVKQIELNTADRQKAEREYEKVQEEVELLKTLNHCNIVGYLGTSLEDSTVSIFMQFVPGGSIASILARFGALDETVFRLYTRQILQGVEYLHNNDVIHRDIKGGNVMLMPNGIIKLIDFGCAKRLCINLSLSQSQILRSMKGTPYWMAPEVVNESGHGKKSDIWSIGCTIFEMATRKPPWADMNPMAAIFAIGSDRAVPSLPDKFSAQAIAFVTKCLTRDQQQRPSATELLTDIFMAEQSSKK